MAIETEVPKFDERDAIRLVTNLLGVPGRSCEEQAIADLVVDRLRRAGVSDRSISFDRAHHKSRRGGEVGNLIVKIPGTKRGPRRLLMAHLDTVPLCVGAQPVIRGGEIVSKDPTTALGGDNRAGCAVILNALQTLLRSNVPYPPLTFVWTVQEELGLLGARHLSASKLGKPQLCFNWDGGAPNAAVIGATGDDHIDIEIHGLASHAGAHPEDGVSASAIAGLAIADLQKNGWHGKVVKGKQQGTSNIGSIRGGEATNVVTDRLTLTAEVRSHQAPFRRKIIKAYEQAFQHAARSVTNAQGECGHVEFSTYDKYESFRIPKSNLSVQAAIAAIEAEGLPSLTRIIDGGLDANWLTAHGFPTVTLGCGQAGIHTVNESLNIAEYLTACRIALRLATG
ncbi:MAG: M20/M25/M40 family metallo-hydrolase [Planctomycetaceae bacterium]|nr:M20/M25/M40 family metallo-hydrolase [Planctomycetaceae bacterium]